MGYIQGEGRNQAALLLTNKGGFLFAHETSQEFDQ
jgi:hypothetical protein